jgi:hypothetical protein
LRSGGSDVTSARARRIGEMSINVECHAGYRGDEEPRAFVLGSRRFAVLEVVDRWIDPSHRYFKVRVDDGRQFILCHDSASGAWELAGLVGSAPATGYPGPTIH